MAIKKGREFELLTEDIFLKLRNDERFEQVERNVIINGPDGPREIDVLLTTESFGIKIRTVVECKDFKTKVGVGIIDSIVSKMQDVGASKGIVVSRSGFSSQAIAKAKRNGLSLFTAHEAILGKVIRQVREEKGVTQEKLAELAEVDRTYIYRIEAGKRSPSIDIIFRIADALKITPGNLLDKVNRQR
jgi:DNA-binding XRE family transcriptional regulator